MNERSPHHAGFSLVEAMVSLTITLLAVTFILQGSHMVDSVYWADSFAADGTAEAKWAFDDIAEEVAWAGYGMGDLRFALPYLPDERTPSSRHLTLRSNPEGRVGIPQEVVPASHVPVAVAGGADFRVGDRVLLVDRIGSESAVVLHADAETLTLRSLETLDGSLRGRYSPERRARILGLREVRFGFETTDAGSILWKEVSGNPRRILSRSLEKVQFDHLDGDGRMIDPSQLEIDGMASAIRIHLRLDESLQAASIPALTTAVALGRHSVTIDLPMVTPPRLTKDHLLMEVGPVIESPMGPR